MNQYIAEILKCRIENMSFVDKVAGLVMPVTANIDGGLKIFPVAANSNHNDCITGQYNDLMPNSRYKSVMYFEDLGIEFGTRNGDIQEFRSRLKLVAWLNLARIMDENCPDSGSICAVLETINALNQKIQNYAPVLSLAVDINQVTRDKSIFSEYTYDEKYSQYLFYPYDFFAITITVRGKINYACLCDTNLPTGCYPAVPSIVKQICIDAESFDGTMIDGDCIRLKDFADDKYYANVNGQWVEVTGGGTNNHNELNNLGFSESGHTGFEAEGAAAQALSDANDYTDSGLSTKLSLEQTSKETLTDSPKFANLTAGRILVVNTDGSITDFGELTWDSTNKRLKIGNHTALSGSYFPSLGIFVDTTSIGGLDFKNENAAGQTRFMSRNNQNDFIATNIAGSSNITAIFGLLHQNLATLFLNATTDTDKALIIGTVNAGAVGIGTSNTIKVWIAPNGNVNIGAGAVAATEKLQVTGNIKATGSVQVGDNTALASASNVGAARYRETANASYYDVCVRNGAASYIWKNLNTETW